MKILVTGGTGFVGSHCVRALAGKGHALRLLVRSEAKAQKLFGTQLSEFELVQGDMTDAVGVRAALEGCDGVLHAAAMVALDANQADAVMKANDQGVRAVLGGAVELGLSRIVHVSSVAAIFDPDGPPSTCDSPLAQGSSPYARSKAAGDHYARELQAEGAPVHISYPVAVVGPDDPGLSEANHALAYMLKTTTVLTEGAFQMVDVRDLAQGHAALFDADASPTKIGGRHLFGGHCLSWRELTDALSEVVGHKVRRISLPAWSLRAMGKAADTTRRALPFLPLSVPVSAEGMVYMTRWTEAQSSPSVGALGVRFRAPTQTLGDTLRSLHAAGQLSTRAIGGLAPSPDAAQR